MNSDPRAVQNAHHLVPLICPVIKSVETSGEIVEEKGNNKQEKVNVLVDLMSPPENSAANGNVSCPFRYTTAPLGKHFVCVCTRTM